MAVPLHPDKIGKPSILTPDVFASHNAEHGWLDGHDAPEAAIMLYHRGLAELIVEQQSATLVRGFLADYFLLDDFDRRIALVANFGIGAPAAVFTFEDLAGAGLQHLITLGTCGGIQTDLSPGDIILCTDALRDEGTSYHYVSDGVAAEADTALTEEVGAQLGGRMLTARTGTSWTTDAPYRETAAEVQAHRADGVLCVEMEASALFTVARERGVPTASLLTVSDILSDHDWAPSFHADETMRSLTACVTSALTVLAARLS